MGIASLSFWGDRWLCSKIILQNHLLLPLLHSLDSKRVVDMVLDDGSWDVVAFAHFIPAWQIAKIVASHPSWESLGDDKVVWSYTSHGGFSTKPTFDLIVGGHGDYV